MKQNILIFGASGHSSVIIDMLEKGKEYNIIGYIDSDVKKHGELFMGYKILGSKKDLSSICKENNVYSGLVAIGNNWKRRTVSELIQQEYPGFKFISIIHPSVQIAKNVKVGEGSVVMGGAIINSNTIIGNHCILNSGCIVEHDCVVNDFSSIAPGAVIGGNVYIGSNSAISIGAVVKNNINIGEASVIGANSTVLQDIGNNVVVYGTPAKFIRNRDETEEYLT